MAGKGWCVAACISVALLGGLWSPALVGAMTLTDTTGRQVDLAAMPERLVALTPSAVEILFDLGAGTAVVGRSASGTVFPLKIPLVLLQRQSVEEVLQTSPDGSGKFTLLKGLARLLAAMSGAALLDGGRLAGKT